MELKIPVLPDGLEILNKGDAIEIHAQGKPRATYVDIDKNEEGAWQLLKWVPTRKTYPDQGDYEKIGEYESAQAALDVAAALLFLGEIEYGYD